MQRLIETVAGQLQYDQKWANDEVGIFLSLLKDPGALFSESKSQRIVLYSDESVIIYAVLWEWVLTRKLKRLQMKGQVQRSEDWKDCVAITKLLYDKNGGKLHPGLLQRFDHTDRESPVLSKVFMDLRRLVIYFHGKDPFHDVQSQPSAGISSSSSTVATTATPEDPRVAHSSSSATTITTLPQHSQSRHVPRTNPARTLQHTDSRVATSRPTASNPPPALSTGLQVVQGASLSLLLRLGLAQDEAMRRLQHYINQRPRGEAIDALVKATYKVMLPMCRSRGYTDEQTRALLINHIPGADAIISATETDDGDDDDDE